MRRVLREVVLTLGALAGVAGIALAVAATVFGVRPMVVTSGSMSPAIDTGAVVWVRSVPAGDVRIGDVVSVGDGDGDGGRVTHRVVAIGSAGTTLTLRGDANPHPDAPVAVGAEVDRVVASVEGLGYVLAWLNHPIVAGAATLAVMGLLVLAFRADRSATPRRPEQRETLVLPAGRPISDGEPVAPARQQRVDRSTGGRSGRRRAVSGALAIALVAAATVTGLREVDTSRAAWTDAATASTGSFAAHTVLAPASLTCSNEGGVLGLLGYARLRWPHRDARYSYSYSIVRTTGGTAVTGTVTATGGVGSDVVLDVTSPLLSLILLGNVNYTVTIRSFLTASPTWTSAGAQTTTVRGVNIVLIGLSVQCVT